jgi:hypothetical protein
VRVTLEMSVVLCVVKNVEVLPKTSVVSKVSVKLKMLVEKSVMRIVEICVV